MEVLNEIGGWTFKNSEVVDNFDSHVVKSVPLYNMFHDMLVTFSRYYATDDTVVLDIGTSTGHLLNKMQNANHCKDLTYLGLDYSKEMIDKAKGFYPNLNFIEADLTRNDTYNIIKKYGEVSYITSMLCLQFIPQKHRFNILNNLYNILEENGAFVIVEKIKSDNIDLHDIYNNKYYEFKRDNGLTDKEILDKTFSLQGQMFPLTLNTNIELLQKVGFKTVEIFMKYNNFVGIIAIK